MPTFDDLLKAIKTGGQQPSSRIPLIGNLRRTKPTVDLDLVRLAVEDADDAHRGQTRKSGAPYIEHCRATAIPRAERGIDQDTIIAELLHDVPEDTNVTLVYIEKNFGKSVAN